MAENQGDGPDKWTWWTSFYNSLPPHSNFPFCSNAPNSHSTRHKQKSYRVFHPGGSSPPLQSLAGSNLTRSMILWYSHPFNGVNNNTRNPTNEGPVAFVHPEVSNSSLQSLAENNSTRRVTFVLFSLSGPRQTTIWKIKQHVGSLSIGCWNSLNCVSEPR